MSVDAGLFGAWLGLYDAFRYGIDQPADAATTPRERACTSPTWYTPKA